MRRLLIGGMLVVAFCIFGCARNSQMMVNPQTGQKVMVETYPGNLSLGAALQADLVQKQRIKYLRKYGYVPAEEQQLHLLRPDLSGNTEETK